MTMRVNLPPNRDAGPALSQFGAYRLSLRKRMVDSQYSISWRIAETAIRSGRTRIKRTSQPQTTEFGGEVMDIAITGATGFLGRYLVRHLAAAGNRLRCWHREGSDCRGLEDWAQVIEWVPGQLGDKQAVYALVRGVDAVVHAAV